MRAETGEAGIEYDVTGAGQPVILLHGFPDSGRLWRHQVPVLADAGFRVIVPDLRGYGRSGKPGTAASYSFPSLVGDVMAVLSDAGVERAHVVGHDWGAALGWVFASLVPDRVDHLAVLSVGHPATFRRSLEQHEKSWYMLLFQFPGVAEQWLSDNNWANFRSWARHPDSDAVIAELEATKIPDARSQLVPGQRASRVLGGPSGSAAGRAGADHGDLEQRRHRPHRDTDDRFGRERDRALAL